MLQYFDQLLTMNYKTIMKVKEQKNIPRMTPWDIINFILFMTIS